MSEPRCPDESSVIRPLVLACGEPLRGDDAAAAAVVAMLDPAIRDLAEVRVRPSVGLEELLAIPDDQPVIIVDAVLGPEPGTLIRTSLVTLEETAQPWVPISGHQLPLAQTLAIAEVLGWTVRGTFLGVGAASCVIGESLSPAVADALPGLCALLEVEIEALAGPTVAGEPISGAPAAPR
ncbi:MAG: hydrogenase maturation protease [Chloroflexi bacterium]|nr:hydrogenase maturation protease [Chloroflexota bacterium]